MAVNSVDMDMALMYASEAQKACRSSELTPEQKGQLINKWGLDQVNQWMEVDGTEYRIDDESKESAKTKGRENAQNATDGFDGKSDGTSSAISAVGNVLTGAFGALVGVVSSIVYLSKKCRLSNGSGYLAAIYGAVMLANATYIKAADPNSEPAEACEQMNEVLQEGQCSLFDAQDEMTRAAEEVTELTEEAEDTKEEADSSMEEDKTILDFYKVQFASVKNKEGSGETLSSDEKALKTRLAPLMKELSLNIEKTGEDTEGTLKDIGSDIGEYQDIYDESAETMEEVQGETEFSAGFDEATVDNAKMVAFTSQIGKVGCGGIAAMGGYAIATSGLDIGAKIAGGVAIAESGAAYLILNNVIEHQNEYQAKAEAEVNVRHETEDLNTQTMETYDEELDNYSGNVDIVDALPDELEIPEDISVPTDTAGSGSGGEVNNPFTVAPKQNDSEDGKNNNNGEDDEKKTKKV